MNDFDRVLTDSTREVEDARNILARLFRQILLERQIGPTEALQLMAAWIADPKNNIPHTLRGASYERGNLIKELSNSRMSWKVFIKAMRWLRIPRITFIVRCHQSEFDYTEHSVSAQFYPFEQKVLPDNPPASSNLYDLDDNGDSDADPKSDTF